MSILLLTIEPATEVSSWGFGATDLYTDILIVALVIVMLTLLFSALVVQRAMKSILSVTMPDVLKKEEEERIQARAIGKLQWKDKWNKLLGLRPIDQEKDLMMEHEFDGIRELDNPIPIWFNVLFYSSIVFGIIYLLIYQVFYLAPNQDQEYAIEMEKAEIAKMEYLAKAANQVDENTVVFNASQAGAGKAIFMTNCVACHGAMGEGGIGPNLTDEYWIHGGDIKDIFKTVKYGVPEKGMVPWEQTLTPGQIAEVSSYILTLQGTNPANAKGPEGVVFVQEETEVDAEAN